MRANRRRQSLRYEHIPRSRAEGHRLGVVHIISSALREEYRDNDWSDSQSKSPHALAILGSGLIDYGFDVPERLADVFSVSRDE